MPCKISEEITRKELIDPQLERAGWYLRDHTKVKEEIPVDGYDKEPWNGVSDYCLYRENGEVFVQQSEFKITQHNYNADQICFLHTVPSAFLQKRHLSTIDIYEPHLIVLAWIQWRDGLRRRKFQILFRLPNSLKLRKYNEILFK